MFDRALNTPLWKGKNEAITLFLNKSSISNDQTLLYFLALPILKYLLEHLIWYFSLHGACFSESCYHTFKTSKWK